MSARTTKKRAQAVVARFLSHQLPARTELRHRTPFELLVSVVLSAQCTDKRVNAITPELFDAYPTAEAMAVASFEDLFPYIKSISYPNNKTRHLLETARLLVEKHQGQVPREAAALEALPGVGRKTANVLRAELYGDPVMAVDTHVFRVAHRLQLVDKEAKTPLAVEKGLIEVIEEKHIAQAHHWLILHGRYVCTARKASCGQCLLNDLCPSTN